MEISTQKINISHDLVSQKRFINFDLLRVAAMFGIVVLHYFTHGLYYHFNIPSGGTMGLSMSTFNFIMFELVGINRIVRLTSDEIESLIKRVAVTFNS